MPTPVDSFPVHQANPVSKNLWFSILSVGFVGLFGLLLASFPARNTDVWQHLASGRDLLKHGQIQLSSVYDLASYAVYQMAGGAGLVGVKAILIALTSIVIVLTGHRKSAGWRIAVACSILAILAMSSRVLLQPHSVGYFFFAILICPLLGSSDERVKAGHSRYLVPVLFVLWALFDLAFVIGLLVSLVAWMGKRLDQTLAKPAPEGTSHFMEIVKIVVLFTACLVALFYANRILLPFLNLDKVEFFTPFSRNYVSFFSDQPAALAYFPLLILTVFAFLLTLPTIRWRHVLPWTLLAVISAYQARTIPYFAIASGPLLAWMLQDWFALRNASIASKPRRLLASLFVGLLSVLFAAAFLAFAWTGMLQGPPYGPRQWGLDLPPGVEKTAMILNEWYAEKLIPADAKTLHISQDTQYGFAWFCPDDHVVTDREIKQANDVASLSEQLRKLGVKRIVASVSDSKLNSDLLQYFISQSQEWPIRSTSGGVVIFSVNNPELKRTGSSSGSDSKRSFDINRMAFRPTEAERIPLKESPSVAHRSWKDYFVKFQPRRSADRDESSLFLIMAEAERQMSADRLTRDWSLSQYIAFTGQSIANPIMPILFDRVIRMNATPFNQFRYNSGDVSTAVLYPTVRACRRAIIDNPNDAHAYLNLGRTYRYLLEESTERYWAATVSSISKLRLIQASTAFNQAVALNPQSPQARLEFARQLRKLDCQDSAIEQLEAYRDALIRIGESKKEGMLPAIEEELVVLHGKLDEQTREFEKDAQHLSVMDRAYAAVKRGLTTRALKMLKASDFSAFGITGMKLELDLMLRMGQAEEVRNWLMETPDLRGSLGNQAYYWYLTQANAGIGDYAAALDNMTAVSNGNETLPPVQTIAHDIARAIGVNVLSESVDSSVLPQTVFLCLARNNFSQQMTSTLENLTLLADTLTLRTLLVMEMGDVDTASKTFKHLLHQYDPDKFQFNARKVAEQCEEWLDSAKKPSPGPKKP